MKFIQLKMLLPANSYCLTCCPTCTCSFYFTIQLSKFTYDTIIHTCMEEVPASYLDGNTNQTHLFHGFPSILPRKCSSKATAISFHILPSSFPVIQHYTVWIIDSYTVRLLSFRTDCAERILRAPSGGHPQKHIGASLNTLCA